jgi:histidyl-tRNA synthetase
MAVASLQPVRGTHDLLPEDIRRHRRVVECARQIAERYGYQEMATPIFEFTEVFRRTLGETSDVVTKEMYTFADRGGDEITLRPEYTASIARAFISGGLRRHAPLKLFASGPMFRYERPQKGRLRQFHQIDAEVIGVAGPQADIEIIELGAHILQGLGVAELCTLELNTLGDSESRATYRKLLVDYFESHRSDLSEDSKLRLDKNPLRILDSKDDGDRKLIVGAPRGSDSLTSEAADFFASVRDGLDQLAIAYTINEKLVRGLDYYTHTAFEFTTEALGAQGTVIGGGRYDGLIEMMGGSPTPGIGFAGGIERLAMLASEVPAEVRPVAVIPIGKSTQAAALRVCHQLRHAGFAADLGFSGNLSKRMARANKLNASCAVIIGDDELAKDAVSVRDFDSGKQEEVALSSIVAVLNRYHPDGAASA